MGLLDRAKAAATDLAAKADTALSGAGASLAGTANPEALLRDLGMLTYLESTGREASVEERRRIMTDLMEAEKVGVLRSFELRTTAPPAPPPPAAAPPPPGAPGRSQNAPPPSPAEPADVPTSGTVPPAQDRTPPPPPSWA